MDIRYSRNKKPENRITLYITINENRGKSKLFYKDITTLFTNQTLIYAFYNFLRTRNIKIGKNYYFYLKKKNNIERELPKDKIISQLKLKDFDEIYVCNRQFNIFEETESNLGSEDNSKREFGNIIKYQRNDILEENHNTNELNEYLDKKRKKYVLIFVLIFCILIVISLGFIVYLFILKKRKTDEIIKLKIKEDLVIDKKYPVNLFLRYSSTSNVEMHAMGDDFEKFESKNNLTQITDFFFIVRNDYIENSFDNQTEKEWYTGYIGILNLTMRNITHDMMILYDKTLNKYINTMVV